MKRPQRNHWILGVAVALSSPLARAQTGQTDTQAPERAPEAHVQGKRGDVHGKGWSEVLALKGQPLPPRFPKVGDSIERHVLKNGLVVYLAPDTKLPLVNVQLDFRAGEDYETEEDRGLSNAVADRMRRGGAAGLKNTELDAKLEELSASISGRGGASTATISLDAMSDGFDEGFRLFTEVVLRPGLEPPAETDRRGGGGFGGFGGGGRGGRGPQQVAGQEFRKLLYGPDHPLARNRFGGRGGGGGPGGPGGPGGDGAPTDPSARPDRFPPEKVKAAYAKFVRPDAAFLTVVGDFEPTAMLAKIESSFGAWTPPTEPVATKVEKPEPPIVAGKPGVYVIDSKTPQSAILIGHLGITRDDPDRFAIQLMNDVLGGGSFASRITEKVRNDEGLAYSASSSFATDSKSAPGVFQCSVQTKTASTARAIELILGEIAHIREPGTISKNEFDTALESRLYSFGQQFADRSRNVQRLVSREIEGRPADLDQGEYEGLRKQTPADLEAAAKKHLQPDQLVIVVAGDLEAIKDSLAKFGEIHVIDPRANRPRRGGEEQKAPTTPAPDGPK